jgi:rubrerythrin
MCPPQPAALKDGMSLGESERSCDFQNKQGHVIGIYIPLSAGPSGRMAYRTALKGESMDIFEFAMSKEKSTETHYRQLAAKAPNIGIANILKMLAAEEAKHYEAIRQMRDKTAVKVTDAPVLANATAEFEKMRDSAERFSFHHDEVDLYRKACGVEKESRQYYRRKAEEVEDAQQKTIFLKLADEENKHLLLVQAICDFVARPETFLEDAEMYHFDDYVEGAF